MALKLERCEPWKNSNILADDIACVELPANDLALRGDFRMTAILIAIACRIRQYWWLHPQVVELWIQMIEGNDLTDDVWLWMDGDEQWLREHLGRGFLAYCEIPKGDWVDAQSALRRRINQSRHTRHNAGNPRNERIRNATPNQRFAAIYWLTFNSNHVKDLAIELGRTPRGVFGLVDVVSDIDEIIGCSWGVFPPEDSTAWEEAATKLEEDGCTCLEQKWRERPIRSWFNMLSWLDGKSPTMEVIGDYSCMRCKSLCVQHFTSSPYVDEGFPQGPSHVATGFDSMFWAHIRKSHCGMSYASVLFDMTKQTMVWPLQGLHSFLDWWVQEQGNRWNSNCGLD